MKWLEAIESETLEQALEHFSTDDVLKIFLKSGLKICNELGISFWYEDFDWRTYDKFTQDEIDSIYNSACVEKETWMKDDHRMEEIEAVNLVIYSIEAMRGDMKAAIIATSKIGIFSQYDWSDWVEEKEKDKNKRDKKAKESSGKGGKHSPAQERDELILKIFNIKISGRKYNGSMGHNLKLYAKDMLSREGYTKDFPLLEKICNLKDDAIMRIIARKTANK